ncbi:thioredoxin 3, putative [Plasmodium malariae]|uniref:Thioredoxin 3, putative n=2 Tax=Plasmodium malariae TaxID=5858 RepID=A0A1D3JMB7_PLAMA|nr:thioredoxin 3, putative [Plasmodium malariae]SBT87815.1 thioredoxin 3, putative [Plasmodium malariae]
MALICIGSVCFSLFHVGIIILFIINYFYSHIKKFLPQFLVGSDDKDKQIKDILQLKRKKKEYGESTYIELAEGGNLEDIFKSSKNVSVVLKFGASWCKPCVRIKEYFKNQTASYYVSLVDIDVDVYDTLNEEYAIKVLPTFIFYFFLNNEWIITQRIEGASEKELERAFKKYSISKAN